jgi:hypothetical protein
MIDVAAEFKRRDRARCPTIGSSPMHSQHGGSSSPPARSMRVQGAN